MATATKLNIQELSMRQIRVDHGLQARVETKAENVLDYYNAMEAYKSSGIHFGFPPIITYFDGKTYWLADGFHRFAAWAKAGGISIKAEIREGTKQEAILFSVSANLEMGFRPTAEDKKKAVGMLLVIPEYRRFSDVEIARRCGIGSGQTVMRYRTEWHANSGITDDKIREYELGPKTTRYGKAIEKSKRVTVVQNGHIYRPVCDAMPIDMDSNARPGALAPTATVCVKPRQLGITNTHNLTAWLARHGVAMTTRKHGERLSPDLSAPGLIIRVEAKLTPRSLPAALGDVLLWRQASDPQAAAVVVCYPDDDVKDMIRHAKALGVEFLTPHEVVERFAVKMEAVNGQA